MPSEADIIQVDGVHDPYFDDVRVKVALSSPGQAIPFTFQSPFFAENPKTIDIEPRKTRGDPYPIVGFSPPPRLQLYGPIWKKYRALPCLYESPAAFARVLDLKPGDVVVKASIPGKEGALVELDRDPSMAMRQLCQLLMEMRDQP